MRAARAARSVEVARGSARRIRAAERAGRSLVSGLGRGIVAEWERRAAAGLARLTPAERSRAVDLAHGIEAAERVRAARAAAAAERIALEWGAAGAGRVLCTDADAGPAEAIEGEGGDDE